jgi:hypothetical protein
MDTVLVSLATVKLEQSFCSAGVKVPSWKETALHVADAADVVVAVGDGGIVGTGTSV